MVSVEFDDAELAQLAVTIKLMYDDPEKIEAQIPSMANTLLVLAEKMIPDRLDAIVPQPYRRRRIDGSLLNGFRYDN